MREILYRGKRVDCGDWTYGCYYIDSENIPRIVELVKESSCTYHYKFPIIPKTRGEYTGLCDKNGTKIFEGDIVLYSWLSFGELPFYIEFIDGEFCATPLRQTDDLWQIRISGENLNFEVIGNIHDNPELLEEKQ